ncbi:MAG: N-acetylmuramoyl-L-alanine amidase, partial [Acutalibacteraceae bacterium]
KVKICEREKNMKRKRMLILAAAAAVIVVAVITAVLCIGKSEPVLSQSETETATEEAVKALKNEFIMRIAEGKDIDFSNSDEAEAKEAIDNTVSAIKNGFCKSVTVKADAFSKTYDAEKDAETPDKDENAAFFSFVKKLNENNIKVYTELDFSFPLSFAKALLSNNNIDGLVITGVKENKASTVNKKLASLYKTVKKQDKRLVLSLSASYPYYSALELDKEHFDLLMIPVSVKDNDTDIKKAAEKTAALFEKCTADAAVRIDLSAFSENELSPGKLLEIFTETEKTGKFKAVVFNSFSDAREDAENCFSAVEKYVNDGIILSSALKQLSIDGYDGGVLETDNYSLTLKVSGSSLYPAYLDGEMFMFDSDGTSTVELSLKTGLNKFTFTQNGKKITYKIKARFIGELIKSVEPMPNLTAYMGKVSVVTVYAASGSEVTVKVGANKVTAKAQSYESGGYCKYIANIKMPESRMEIESIGRIYVTAVLDSQTQTADGPNVVYSVPETTTSPSVTLPAENSQKDVTDEIASDDFSVTKLTQSTTEGVTYVMSPVSSMQYTGNQMCVVTADYADTWPAGTNSDNFVPFYTTLAKGTMDYVVGQSEAYDSEEEKTRYFYELSCGRRVLQENVMLLERYDMGQNSLSVISSQSNGGELEIKFSTKWKVPYSFSFSPQSYYSANNKLYNVESFTAEYIQFTFYHTSSASGKIDTTGSDVVSSASWGIDSSSGAVTLTMPLLQKGKYFGYSLEYDSSDNLVLKINNNPQSLKGSVIVLDPGHGGKDPGAIGYSGAVQESDLNFATSVAVMNELQKRGATVYLTRYEDKYLTLEERKAIVRSIKPDVFVSIHANGSVNASNYGTSTFYFRPMSKPLAKCIYDELVTAWQGLYASDPERQSKVLRGCDFHPFSVARIEECPSVLVEVGYITNNEECAIMSDTASREKLAAAIANGVEKYMGS